METKRDTKILKEFGLTTLAVKNRTTVIILTVLVVIMGVSSYISLPKENFPEVNIPTIYIGTSHPGNSPIDMENLITRAIEKEVNTIAEVDNIRSTSVQDFSTIIVEFRMGTDVKDALVQVKDAVDKSKPELPTDMPADPNVFELNMSEFPIMNLNLSGNFSLEELNKYAEALEDEIEKFPEISKVEIRGIDEREVRINVNPHAMEARELSFSDIENAISAENVTLSGGSILSNGVRRSIRVLGEFNDPSEMEDIVVKHENNNIVYLRDVATIEFDYKEKESYARLANEPVVMIDIVKRSGENLLIATEKIDEVLEEAKKSFPPGLIMVKTNDQSRQTRTMVSNLENSIISGVILVVLVLLFFLGTRNAIFVGIAIPLSMFMAFMILGAFGITINMMVLFSLIMALGMLVDNGIVVVENVYRLMEQGVKPVQAAINGVGEVAMPVIASTATTLAAFLPLAFWPGMMGEFMKYLPITLIITLGSSLFVALVINPALVSMFMKVGKSETPAKRVNLVALIQIIIGGGLVVISAGMFANGADGAVPVRIFGNIFLLLAALSMLNYYLLAPISQRFQGNILPSLESVYERTIRFALRRRNPIYIFIGTILMFVGSIGLFGTFTPAVVFFPDNMPKYVNVFVEFPVGTDISVTNKFTSEVEGNLDGIVAKYDDIVESVVTNVGEGASDPMDQGAVGGGATPHKARITINFVDFEFRDGISTEEVMEEIRASLRGYPGVAITVGKDSNGPPVGKPITIEISGPVFDKLAGITEDIRSKIIESGIEGIEKLKSDLEVGKPELLVDIDRDKARRFGLSTSNVANEIRTSLFGKEVSKFKQGEDDYEIQLRLAEDYRYDLEALMNKSITYRNQNSGKIRQIPISSVATAEFSSTYGSIRWKDLDRVITLSSNVLGDYNPTVVNDELKALLADYEMPSGYLVKFGGEQEQQAVEMEFLSGALMVAVFLIFLIIVSQFNKVTAPIIIMSSVVFSTIGVFLGLVIFQMEFVVMMTMIGIISLAGIVVNNAIVLIDFIELLRKRKRAELGNDDRLSMTEIVESIIQAGKTRLRPVLLTAITTILGLIPLAIGINIDFLSFFTSYDANFYIGGDNVAFWGPMSWTIIFGLTFATFLTLVVVPVMYLLFDKLNYRLGISKY